MRVKPDLQQRGIASHLLDYLLEYWRRFGGGALRLATASERIAVHQMCHRTGFTKVMEITPYSAECYLKTGKEALAYVRVLDHEIENASRFMKTSESMALSHGLMDLDWRWGAPSPNLLKHAVERGQAWWWRGKRGLLIAEQQSDSERGPRSVIRSLACKVFDIHSCLVDTLGLASSLGSERVIWFAPLDSNLNPTLEAAGFHRDWEQSLYIYQKSHPGST
jgi:hypothetical protein